MKILISGAGGRIGRVITARLAGSADLVFVDRRTGNAGLSKLGKEVTLDILDKQAIGSLLLLEKPDVVIHLAGVVGKAENDKDAGLAYQVNVEATANLAEKAAQAGVEQFIFASSSAVYPTNGKEAQLNESTSNLQPESEYGKQKYLSEQKLGKIASSGDMQIVCLRIFNVYGPGFVDCLLNKLMGAAKAGAVAVNIIDPQHFVRDYIHVNDVAEAFAAVITNLKSQEKFLIINVGTGVARSTARLIEELKANGFEPKTNLQNGEMITNVVADTARAEELLNFRAHTEILFNQL